ncbi:MAG TPA: hypothetical protein VM925_27560 [Labilithrix sp.]|nr:hypothetical protein [Labilithrix sp.]
MKTVLLLAWLKLRSVRWSLMTSFQLLYAPLLYGFAARSGAAFFGVASTLTLMMVPPSMEGATPSGTVPPAFRAYGMSTYRPLPATWRQITIANILVWTIPFAAGLLIVAMTPTKSYLDRLFGPLEPVWVFDVLALWTLTLPGFVVGWWAGRSQRSIRMGTRLILVMGVPAAFTALRFALGTPSLQASVGIGLTAIAFAVPDGYFMTLERKLSAVAPAASTAARSAPARLETVVPTSRPLLRLWWTRTRIDLLLMPIMLLGMLAIVGVIGRERGEQIDPTILVMVLPILSVVPAAIDGPHSTMRSVIARLPVSCTDVALTGLAAGSALGSLLGSLSLGALLLRASFDPHTLLLTRGTHPSLVAALAGATVLAIVTVSQLARMAPVGACPHYRKLALASLMPYGVCAIVPRSSGPVVLVTITCLHLAMGAVMVARMGRLRSVR